MPKERKVILDGIFVSTPDKPTMKRVGPNTKVIEYKKPEQIFKPL
jgi:hypothetical protein